MRWWLLVTVAVVALTACTDAAILDPDSGNETETAGNTALFCRAWPEARRTVVNMLEGEDQRFRDAQSAGIVDETMEQYDRAVPVEIRAEWDRLYDTYTKASDLLSTVAYGGHTIRTEHVTMMFGPGGMELAMSDASKAIEAIDEWSVTGCGDFCSHWLEYKSILQYEQNFDPHRLEQNLGRWEVALSAGNRLVPGEISDAWDTAVDIQVRRFTMARENDFRLDIDEDTALSRWGVIPWDEAMEISDVALGRVDRWIEANCDLSAVTGGAPGTLSVRIRPRDDLVGRTILLALLPIGTDFGSVTGPDEYLGALCTQLNHAPELLDRELANAARESDRTEEEVFDEWWGAEPMRPIPDVGEYHEGSICNLVGHEYGGQGPGELVLPGGPYELFTGTFIGDPGSYALYFAAPERCAQVTVNVDGDTVVDLPALDECDLEAIGSAEEIARRPSTPATGSSHLWVEIPSAIYQEGSPGYFVAILLPAGTTLGEIGRGDAWPVGGFQFGYVDLEHENDPRAVRRTGESGLVPVLPYGPGGGVVSLGPQIDWKDPWDGFFPDPVALDPGIYDLRIVGEWGPEDCDDDSCRHVSCGSVVVRVNGDTVVSLPEWGECP